MKQDFKQDLYEVFDLINSNQPFSLMRFADGEIGVMQGKHVNGSDNWVSPNHATKLGTDLLEAVQRVDPNIYYGFSCECCDLPGKNYLLDNVKTSISNITFSNLFVNGNYTEFKARLKKINKPIHLIANERSDLKFFPIDIESFLPIADNCVEFWEKFHVEFKLSLKEYYQNESGKLFLIAAGPMSEVIIDYLWSVNPNNQYVDVGSSIAEFTYGHPIRDFGYEHSPYQTKICKF